MHCAIFQANFIRNLFAIFHVQNTTLPLITTNIYTYAFVVARTVASLTVVLLVEVAQVLSILRLYIRIQVNSYKLPEYKLCKQKYIFIQKQS